MCLPSITCERLAKEFPMQLSWHQGIFCLNHLMIGQCFHQARARVAMSGVHQIEPQWLLSALAAVNVVSGYTLENERLEHNNGSGWKMMLLFKGVIFRFHVNFPGVYSSKIGVAKGERKVICIFVCQSSCDWVESRFLSHGLKKSSINHISNNSHKRRP